MKKLLLLSLMPMISYADIYGTVSAKAMQGAGNRNFPTVAICKHAVDLHGHGKGYVKYTLCVQSKGCKYYEYEPNVNEHFSNEYGLNATYTFGYSGAYQLTCKTYASGAGEKVDYSVISVY